MYVGYFTKYLNWHILLSSFHRWMNRIKPSKHLITIFYLCIHILFLLSGINFYYDILWCTLKKSIMFLSQMYCTYKIVLLQIDCYILQSYNVLFSDSDHIFNHICISITLKLWGLDIMRSIQLIVYALIDENITVLGPPQVFYERIW